MLWYGGLEQIGHGEDFDARAREIAWEANQRTSRLVEAALEIDRLLGPAPPVVSFEDFRSDAQRLRDQADRIEEISGAWREFRGALTDLGRGRSWWPR